MCRNGVVLIHQLSDTGDITFAIVFFVIVNEADVIIFVVVIAFIINTAVIFTKQSNPTILLAALFFRILVLVVVICHFATVGLIANLFQFLHHMLLVALGIAAHERVRAQARLQSQHRSSTLRVGHLNHAVHAVQCSCQHMLGKPLVGARVVGNAGVDQCMFMSLKQQRQCVIDFDAIFVDVRSNVKQSALALLFRPKVQQVCVGAQHRGKVRIVVNDPTISVLELVGDL